MKKIALKTAKYLCITVLLLAFGLGFGVWFIASESLTSEKLTPVIEMAVTRLIPGSKAQIGESSITWDKEKHTISITCRDVKYLDDDGTTLATYPNIGLEIGLWSLLSGRTLPRRMDSAGAVFYLTRTAEGGFIMGAPQEQLPPPGEIKAEALGLKDFLETIGNELANDSLRHNITITNALLRIRDATTNQNWTVTVPSIKLLHSREGATGEAIIQVAQGEHISGAHMTYSYDAKETFHNISFTFQEINLSHLLGTNPNLPELTGVDIPLTGKVALATDENINLMRTDIHLIGGEGTLTNTTFWKNPRKVKNANLNLHYENSLGLATVSDTFVEFDGPKLSASGTINVPVHKRYAWKLPRMGNSYEIKLRLENLAIDAFDAYWPLLTLPDAREWIVASMSKGVFPSGEITMKGVIDWANPAETTLDEGTGKLYAKGGSVLYMEDMPLVEDVDAEATFDFKSMDVLITTGRTGTIKLKPFTIKMRDLHKDIQTIEIPARLSGPVRDILRLIDSKPLGYAKAIGIDPEDGSGNADGLLTLNMPMIETLRLDDVQVRAEASLSDVGFKKLIPGIEISQGKLDFSLFTGGFTLNGNVALNNVMGQLEWASRFSEDPKGKEPLHKALVKTRMKPEDWAAFGLGNLLATQGETPLTIRYANVRAGVSTLGGDVDFRPVAVKVPSIGWNKPAGMQASLSFDGNLPDGKPYDITALNLQGKALRIKGKASIDMKTGELLSADLNPYVVGRSNAAVSYSKNVADKSENVRIMGDSFDISGLDNKKNPSTPQAAKDYTLRLTKLYTSENGFMSSAKIRAVRDAKGWKDIDFWGVAQGTTPTEIKLIPEGKQRVLSIKADDFGAFMKGMGYSDGINGGTINVWGRNTPENPDTIKGLIRISDFSVNNVPIFARLLSAVSPFGFIDLITGKAHFDNLRGDFSWHGDDIDLVKVRAAGSVVGINIDGRMNLNTGMAKLSGTVVPFSFVNSILGSIPLLGDVITGGDGQGVIAAAYSIDGTFSEPNISVNPVSLLTPGFLRNLFFSNEDPEPKPAN